MNFNENKHNKPKEKPVAKETGTDKILQRLRNKTDYSVMVNNAVVSSIILDSITKAEHIHLLGISTKINTSDLQRIYLEKNGGVVLKSSGDPLTSNINPRDYNNLLREFHKAIMYSSILCIRIRLVEQNEEGKKSVFQKTGNHIVSALLDCRPNVEKKLVYYCPVGGGCAIDFSPFLTLIDGSKIPVISNSRQDQSLEDDGYCALYNHSMILAQIDDIKNASDLAKFPENSQETMFQRVAKSFEDFELKKYSASL
jgi:hypothetical protein